MKNLALRLVIILAALFPFGELMAKSYYWVGGSGNWSDLNHWVDSVGVHPPVVPSPFDNVIFNASSFTAPGQTVTINQTVETCHNMIWTGVPDSSALSGPATNSLKIYGSLTLTQAMKYDFLGKVYFDATGIATTLLTAGKVFKNSIYFEGDGGSWNLNDSLNVGKNGIFLLSGTLNTNNQRVRCGYFDSAPSSMSPRSLNLGTSEMILTSNTNPCWNVYQDSLSITANQSLLRFTGKGAGMLIQPYPFQNYHPSATVYNFNKVLFENTEGTATLANVDTIKVIFKYLIFQSHARIKGSMTFDTLVFTPGHLYEFQDGTWGNYGIYQINSLFSANGSCTNPILIRSIVAGARARIKSSSGVISVSNTSIRDIQAFGGASFIATDTRDLGNNTGWNISGAPSQNLFWVGGTGYWDEPWHWSTVSGGSGGLCLPTADDNVFFDQNSFPGSGQAVLVKGIAQCRDMKWNNVTPNSKLYSTHGNSLRIYGSLLFDPYMQQSFSSPIYFEASTTGKTITTSGKIFYDSIYFSGAGGSWRLQDSLRVPLGRISLYNGTLYTNNKHVICNMFLSDPPNKSNGDFPPRTLNLGKSVLTIQKSSPYCWQVTVGGLTIFADSSTLQLPGKDGGMYFAFMNPWNFQHYYFNKVEFSDTTGRAEITYTIDSNFVTFRKVSFSSNALITGSYIFDTLQLADGKIYEFKSGCTQKFNSLLDANASCQQPIKLRSTVSGVAAIFKRISGTITVDHCSIRDIKATGGSVFTANNSTDLGNNANWIFNPSPVRDLYWVGGGGYWYDAAHWAITSGGTGGQCIPTGSDNVIFDQYSFTGTGQMVTIDDDAVCRDMTWMNNVATNSALAGSTAMDLSIIGSLTFCSTMNYMYQGEVYFRATNTGNTITTAGKAFNNFVYFQGAGGEWKLLDSFNAGNVFVFLVNGTLNTNGQPLTCYEFNSSPVSPQPRALVLGTSLITIKCTTNSAWYAYSNNFSLSATQSTIRLTGKNAGMLMICLNIPGNPCMPMNFGNVEFTDTTGVSQISANSTTSFVKTTFLSDGQLLGNFTFDTLKFSPGRTYHVGAGTTQTLLSHLDATGIGGYPIEIRSTVAGQQGTFYKTNGCIILDYVQIRDNKATGGAHWYAGLNSFLVSNTTGWGLNGPLPTPSVIWGSDSVCNSGIGSYWINPVPGATGYTWSLNPSNAGTINSFGDSVAVLWDHLYTGSTILTVVAADYCTTSSQNLTIDVDSLVSNINYFEGNRNICQGTFASSYVTSCNNATGYIWTITPATAGTISGNGSSVNIIWNQAFVGNCTISVQAYNNCDTTTSATINVSVVIPPATPVITVNGATLTSSPEASYLWYLNGNPIQGATNQVYIALTTGDYFVVVTNTFGCSDTSAPVHIVVPNGIATYNITLLSIYPNPTPNNITIELSVGTFHNAIIELYTPTGQIVYSAATTEGISNNKINLTNIPRGFYICKVWNNGALIGEEKIVIVK